MVSTKTAIFVDQVGVLFLMFFSIQVMHQQESKGRHKYARSHAADTRNHGIDNIMQKYKKTLRFVVGNAHVGHMYNDAQT